MSDIPFKLFVLQNIWMIIIFMIIIIIYNNKILMMIMMSAQSYLLSVLLYFCFVLFSAAFFFFFKDQDQFLCNKMFYFVRNCVWICRICSEKESNWCMYDNILLLLLCIIERLYVPVYEINKERETDVKLFKLKLAQYEVGMVHVQLN